MLLIFAAKYNDFFFSGLCLPCPFWPRIGVLCNARQCHEFYRVSWVMKQNVLGETCSLKSFGKDYGLNDNASHFTNEGFKILA